MRYTKAFKISCVRKYKAGKHLDHPGGCKYKTFKRKVFAWIRIYDALGEAGFEHKKPKRTWEDKMTMIQRVLDGESMNETAQSNGIQCDLLSKWYQIYQKSGVDGLKLSRRGRPPKMVKKPMASNKQKTKEALETENELLRAENEYLKKLSALVQKRKDRQPKKK